MSNPGSLMATSIINTEISEAKTKFQKLIEYLEGESTKWENYSGVILILDTNVLLHSPKIFFEMNWHEKLAIDQTKEIRIVLPIRIIQELDKMKKTQRNITVDSENPELIRDRARRTLRFFNTKFEVINECPIIAGSDSEESKVTMTLDLKSEGNNFFEDPDGEILYRANQIKIISGREVLVYTLDLALSLRARTLNLNCTVDL